MTLALTLYVNGASASGQRARAHIRALCDAWLSAGAYQLKVVDVLATPEAAEAARIIATPTLIRTAPLPMRRIVGDLSDIERLRAAIDDPALRS